MATFVAIKQTPHSVIVITALIAISIKIFSSLFHKLLTELHEFCNTKWNNFLDIIGEDQLTVWFILPTVTAFSVFIIVGTAYTFLDITNKPYFLTKYKTQREMDETLEISKLPKLVGLDLFNFTFTNSFTGFILMLIVTWRGYANNRAIPPIPTILYHIIFLFFAHEIVLYYMHRIQHTKPFYKRFHKVHHEWKIPVAISAFYFHPLDHAMSNIIPSTVGIIILGSHIVTLLLWYTGAIFIALHTHSGYHFPFLISPESHDYHHAKFNEYYGTFGLMDYIHGTDRRFRTSIFNDRNILAMFLTPVKELLPEKRN